MAKWNLEDALAVSREEGWEDGIEEGLEIAAETALAKGYSLDLIHDLTGLDLETLAELRSRVSQRAPL